MSTLIDRNTKVITQGFIVGVGILGAMAGGAVAQPSDTLPRAVEECIRGNAPKVEQSIESLTAATDFLVGSICAQEISVETQRVQNQAQQRIVDAAQKACDAQKAETKQQDTGRRVIDSCTLLETSKAGLEGAGWTIYAPVVKPPAATALAAKLLLDLRLARATTKPSPDRR
jgi:hypothetical protein